MVRSIDKNGSMVLGGALLRSVFLTCIAGPLNGQIFRLTGSPVFLFGRNPKAHFSLAADPAASQLHFLVDVSDNRVRIFDLGSTNGLIINDRHLGGKMGAPFNEFEPLADGDTILAGACLFRLSIEEPEARQPSPAALGAVLGNVVVANTNRHPTEGKLTAVIPKDDRTGGIAAGGKKTPPSPPPAADAPADGQDDFAGMPQIEGFTILDKIGGGGRGVVYKAIKNDTGASAAIKMMLFNRNKSKKQRSLEMFRREIQITRQLDHPHIIRYLADGISQGLPYLALEYVEGGNLEALIANSPDKRMDLPLAIPLFIQLLEAVSAMHSRSLVHRDIKPKNILLDLRRGGGLAVKLSDMGLSCRFTNQDSDDFLPIICEGGTPAYMPPEQLTDLTRAIPQSDVFSAAATFYQMLTGSLLYDFSGKDQSEAILAGRFKPILQRRPDLPLPIANMVARALSYSPENRFANAQEMLAALKKALEGIS